MKSASDPLKSINAKVKYMVDNQYRATRLILDEQNEMFSKKRSGTDHTDISEFFDSQIDANSDVMRYLNELRDCLTEAIDAPDDLPYVVNRLREEACKAGNEWILETFSEVIEYMEQLRRSAKFEHPSSVEPAPANVLKAA
jgi:hypothetical protein